MYSKVIVIYIYPFFFKKKIFFKGLHLRQYGDSQARGLIRASYSCQPMPQPTRDPSHVCDLHHSSRQLQILNPLSDARDRTCNLMVPGWIHFCCATTGTPLIFV